MLTITREDTKVKIELNPSMPDKKVMFLYWETNSEWYAHLLVAKLQEVLDAKLTSIREAAYREGWKDAKAKHRKQTWFAGWW